MVKSRKKQASTMTYLSHLVWVLLIPAAVLSLRLTSYPDEATQGEEFTLSCIQDSDLLQAAWFRDSTKLFETKSESKERIYVDSNNIDSYLTVSGRITVSISYSQHNVTLRINSTLDDGSVWECDQGGIGSNQLTIQFIQHTTVVSTSQTTTLQNVQTSADSSMDTTKDVAHLSSQPTLKRPKEKDASDYIPLIAGIVAGAVIVVSVVLVTVVCVRRHRNIRKQDTVTTEMPEYCTMSPDHDTDNHYTQLDPRLKQSENEATKDTSYDAYYNTVSEGKDSYENPPLNHSVDQTIK